MSDPGVEAIIQKFAEVEQAYEAAKRSGQEIGIPSYIAVHVALQLEIDSNIIAAPIGFLPEPRRTVAALVSSALAHAGTLFADASENLAVYRELYRIARGSEDVFVHASGSRLSVAMRMPVVAVPAPKEPPGQN